MEHSGRFGGAIGECSWRREMVVMEAPFLSVRFGCYLNMFLTNVKRAAPSIMLGHWTVSCHLVKGDLRYGLAIMSFSLIVMA